MVQHLHSKTRHTLAFPTALHPDAMYFPGSRGTDGDWMTKSLGFEARRVPQRPKTTLPISSTRVQKRSEEFYTLSSSFEPIPVTLHRDVEQRGTRVVFPEQEGADRPVLANERHRGYLHTGNRQSQPGRFSHSTTRTNSSTMPGLTLSGSGTSTSRTLSHPSSRPKPHIPPQPLTTARPPNHPSHVHNRNQRVLTGIHPGLNIMATTERPVKPAALVSTTLAHPGPHSRLEQWRNEVARDAYAKTAEGVGPSHPSSKASAHRERKLSLDARPQHQLQTGQSRTLPAAMLAPKIRSTRTVPPMDFQPAVSNPHPLGFNTQSSAKGRLVASRAAAIDRPRSTNPLPAAAVHSRLLSHTAHVARPHTSSTPQPTPPSRPRSSVHIRTQISKPLPPLPAPSPIQRPSQLEQPRKIIYREYEYGLADELVSLCSGVDSTTGDVIDYGGQTVKMNGLGQNINFSQGPGGTRVPYRSWYARPNNDDVVDISTERANSPSEY